MAAETEEILARAEVRRGAAARPRAVSPPTASPASVMLLDLNWKQTGYLVAALSNSGIATTLITTVRPDSIALSHYCTQIESPHPRSAEYVPFLRRQIASVRPDLLMPLCEPLMEMVWDLDPPCEVPVHPAMTAHQRSILGDRRRFYERAAALGIDVPPWMPIGSPADLEVAARRFGYPLVLRGTRGLAGSQVRVVGSLPEAAAALGELQSHSPGQPFAQAFIKGHRHLVGGFFAYGEAIRLFAQETIEQHPAVTGPSTRVRACGDEALIGSARTLLADLEWFGMACVEFIRDERGRFILMEVNPRPWAALEAAERSGADICRAFAETLAGRPVAPSLGYRLGGPQVVLEGFLLARNLGRGIGPTLRTLSLRDWIDCLRAVPWRKPWLALHVLRRLYRELG
ncbi:MAG TPA: ATP-grasp domain-containing protein [Steroidobacteraceae bacterium]